MHSTFHQNKRLYNFFNVGNPSGLPLFEHLNSIFQLFHLCSKVSDMNTLVDIYLFIYLFGREHGRELVFTDVECFKCIDHNNVK